MSLRRLPFHVERYEDVRSAADAWISDVFYDRLPELGYEIREEQIFTAFHMYHALCERGTHIAEAGLGTGKTFAYLLGALVHARTTDRPVVIACGSTSLVAQLMGPDGDIQKLSRALNLTIDARAALDASDHVCAEALAETAADPPLRDGVEELVRWAQGTTHGARYEMPAVADDLWTLVCAPDSEPCDNCGGKNTCPAARARSHYRGAKDLIVCTHQLFFRHLRSLPSRLDKGHLPLLPTYSAIVLDEAHRVEDTARREMGNGITERELLGAIDFLGDIGTRESFAYLQESTREASQTFFRTVASMSLHVGERHAFPDQKDLLRAATTLGAALERFEEELSIEEGLMNYTLSNYSMAYRRAWSNLEDAQTVLRECASPTSEHVVWVERQTEAADDDEPEKDAATEVLWVAPFDVSDIVGGLSQDGRIPVILTSATLARPDVSNDAFGYIKEVLGLDGAAATRVPSPYDYAAQCAVFVPEAPVMGRERPASEANAVRTLACTIRDLIEASRGRTLVLFARSETMEAVRAVLEGELSLDYPLLWEGDASHTHLLSAFARDVDAVLFGVSFWEGISVEGPSLSHCVISELPFPADDPVVERRRMEAVKEKRDPFAAIDVPEMTMRLRQGAGRVIRSERDRGVISCLDTSFLGTKFEAEVWAAFPEGAPVVRAADAVRDFFTREHLSQVEGHLEAR